MLNKRIKIVQAIEKTESFQFWITIILVVLFGVVFLLKIVDSKLLKQQVKTFFKVPFVALETDENVGIFNPYQILIFLFSTLTFSLLINYFILFLKEEEKQTIAQFTLVFVFVFLYFLLKWILEYLITLLFSIQKSIKIYIISKWNYLFSLSFFAYTALVFYEYIGFKLSILFYFILFLLVLRFVFIFITNKKLIFSKLFYFILYLCAFEIAPLFILFKLMF